ncbi:hypothetical protein BMR85_029190 [Achromobacter sp. KAs 3-5]|nr:hypothetical protein BMR85_029190 [Achromobacter sp. KAs 3-5]
MAGLRHHSDKGVQYVAVRYTQRLAQAGAVASVGSTGDSYDNALAEAFNSLFKAELIRNKGPFTSIEDLEIAVAEYIDWFNHRRVHGEIRLVPPVEFEDVYHHENPVPAPAGTHLRASNKPGAIPGHGWADGTEARATWPRHLGCTDVRSAGGSVALRTSRSWN